MLSTPFHVRPIHPAALPATQDPDLDEHPTLTILPLDHPAYATWGADTFCRHPQALLQLELRVADLEDGRKGFVLVPEAEDLVDACLSMFDAMISNALSIDNVAAKVNVAMSGRT